jgi:hypothetical protein
MPPWITKQPFSFFFNRPFSDQIIPKIRSRKSKTCYPLSLLAMPRPINGSCLAIKERFILEFGDTKMVVNLFYNVKRFNNSCHKPWKATPYPTNQSFYYYFLSMFMLIHANLVFLYRVEEQTQSIIWKFNFPWKITL